MKEFSDDLSTLLSGKEAVKQRIVTRLRHSTEDIPYCERGVDISEFTYGSPLASIMLAFKDFGAQLYYDDVNSRIKAFDIEINVNDILETQ